MTESKGKNYNNFDNPQQSITRSNISTERIYPNAGNVLFVADLPDETSEEDLINLFKNYNFKCGRVTHGNNKTFALAHFDNTVSAEKARIELNGTSLLPKYSHTGIKKPIRLCRWEPKQVISERNEDDYKKSLLIKNLSKEVTAHYLWNLVRENGDIRSCKLAVDITGVSKCFAYVTFYEVTDSENFREKFNGKEIKGKPLLIEFLKPGIRTANKKNNVYVKHFPKENFTEKDLAEIFSKYGELISVVIAPDNQNKGMNRGFGFVCFKSADDAMKAQKELNGVKKWDNLPFLYVNFAMKKEERKEHLLKRKEELIRNSSKMTIYCKIKDPNNDTIKNELEFNTEIMKYINACFGNNYNPFSIKSRIETKQAFITLRSISDVNTFTNFYNENNSKNNFSLLFNAYKSKTERSNQSYKRKQMDINIHQSNNIQQHPFIGKNYNNFDNADNMNMMLMYQQQMMSNPQFMNNMNMGMGMVPGMNMNMNMNNMGNISNMNNVNNMNFHSNQGRIYNNFDDNNLQNNQQFHQFNNVQNMGMFNQQNIKVLSPEEESEQICDYIFETVSRVYPNEAPKITGMISELPLEELRKLQTDPEKLNDIIQSAYHQITNN